MDLGRVRAEQPHWPLVFMTVLTQLSVGAFAAIWLLQLTGRASRLGVAALVSMLAGSLALGASTMHLGRPIYAYRALKMWKRSWLSREVLLFSLLFRRGGTVFGLVLVPFTWKRGARRTHVTVRNCRSCGQRLHLPGASAPGVEQQHTVADFFLTALLLGPLLAASVGIGERRALLLLAVAAAGAQLLNQAARFFLLTSLGFVRASGVGPAALDDVLFRTVLLAARFSLVGGIILPLSSQTHTARYASLALTLAGEILGRYLFFVSVVPKNMAASYLCRRKGGGMNLKRALGLDILAENMPTPPTR